MASQEERDRIMAEYLAQAGADDEEEEAEFEPGEDDEDDVEAPFEAQDDDEDPYIILKGTLARHDGRLIYKGHVLTEAFHLTSKEEGLHWSVQHPTKTTAEETDPPRMRTIDMDGQMGKRPVHVALTLTAQQSTDANGSRAAGSDGADSKKPAALAKKGDDEDDGKMAASPTKPAPSESVSIYTVFGKGTYGSESFELYGKLDTGTAEHHILPLECQKRTVSAAPIAASAAAAAVVEDDDDEDDADEGMDYDELIALHKDAGMSVEDLRKRYSQGGGADAHDDAKPAAKKQKTAPPEEDSDDDDEYGF